MDIQKKSYKGQITMEKISEIGRPVALFTRHRRDEKKDARISIKISGYAKESLRKKINYELGENTSISECLEKIARGELKLVRV